MRVQILLSLPKISRVVDATSLKTGRLDRWQVRNNLSHADVAQLVAQLTCNETVGGSIPLVGTILFREVA